MHATFFIAFSTLCLLSSAHVRLLYTEHSIRNAAGAQSDGKYSTAGPCGGEMTFGANGINKFYTGTDVTLKVAYNGGHQSADNAFKLALVCGKKGPDDDMKNGAGVLTEVPTVPATDSLTSGYELTFTVPNPIAGTDGEFCTISALDQRNWGGCVDFEIVDGVAPTLPPEDVVMLNKTLSGSYTIGNSDCVADSTDCCCITGTVEVTHVTSKNVGHATLKMNANANCKVPLEQLTRTTDLELIAPTVSGLRNTFGLGAFPDIQRFELKVFHGGLATITNIADAPYMCSAESKSFTAALPCASTSEGCPDDVVAFPEASAASTSGPAFIFILATVFFLISV